MKIVALLVAAAGLAVVADAKNVRFDNISTYRFAHSALVNPMWECMHNWDLVRFVQLIQASANRTLFCTEFPDSTEGRNMVLGITWCFKKNDTKHTRFMYSTDDHKHCNVTSTLNSSMITSCIEGLSPGAKLSFSQNQDDMLLTCLRVVVYGSGIELSDDMYQHPVVSRFERNLLKEKTLPNELSGVRCDDINQHNQMAGLCISASKSFEEKFWLFQKSFEDWKTIVESYKNDVRALATIVQQNHGDVNQMNVLLAKLPNISQDFGSKMHNLARDAVENLFVDEFRNQIDEIIAESLRKHFEKHLNATNITYKILNGWQQALDSSDHRRDIFWEKFKLDQQTRMKIYESVMEKMTESFNNMIDVTATFSKSSRRGGNKKGAFWSFLHRLHLGYSGLWGIFWFGVFNLFEHYAYKFFLCLVLPINIEDRLRKIWYFKACVEVFLLFGMLFDGISESDRTSYVNLLRKGGLGFQAVVTICDIFRGAFPSLTGIATRLTESIIRRFKTKPAAMPSKETAAMPLKETAAIPSKEPAAMPSKEPSTVGKKSKETKLSKNPYERKARYYERHY
jgi:hypothetical protein